LIKKDIFVKDLKSYDEILLIGSGKGIASIKTIKQIGWKRKNLKTFKVLSKYYKLITKKCRPYRFQ
jgi:branched-subunit amino acid aminotransferase/4-amino-4-deoxychorismate lyase